VDEGGQSWQILPPEHFLERKLQGIYGIFKGILGHPMTFEISGHKLLFVLAGLPSLVAGEDVLPGISEQRRRFFSDVFFFFYRNLSNRPGHLNALLEART
jgi:hypothetical protein